MSRGRKRKAHARAPRDSTYRFYGDKCLLMRDPRSMGAQPTRKREGMKLSDVMSLFRIRSYLLNTAAMTTMTFAPF